MKQTGRCTLRKHPNFHQEMRNEILNPCLCSKIRYDDEFLQNVLGQNVCVSSLFDVVRRHIDVVGTEVEVGGRDGTDSPLRLRCEGLRLVIACRRCDDLVSVLVHSTSRCSGQLWLLLCLFLDLGNLLPLGRRCRYFHAEDDVADFWLCQWCNVYAEQHRL